MCVCVCVCGGGGGRSGSSKQRGWNVEFINSLYIFMQSVLALLEFNSVFLYFVWLLISLNQL